MKKMQFSLLIRSNFYHLGYNQGRGETSPLRNNRSKHRGNAWEEDSQLVLRKGFTVDVATEKDRQRHTCYKKCGWDGRRVLQKENNVSLVFPKVGGTVESKD